MLSRGINRVCLRGGGRAEEGVTDSGWGSDGCLEEAATLKAQKPWASWNSYRECVGV